MENKSQAALVEQLAGLVLSVEADEAGFTALSAVLVELDRALEAGELKDTVRQVSSRLGELRAREPQEALKVASDGAVALQRLLSGQAAPRVPSTFLRVHRDADTLDLVRDFLQESGDGLASADEMLLSIEAGGFNSEKVNALFRVFHTIKGLAGFLELTELVGLAHATESLMNEVREHRCELAGEPLDLVFKATALLRIMLASLKQACEASVAVPTHDEAPALINRIKDFLERLAAAQGNAAASPTVVTPPSPAPMPSAPTPSAPMPSAPTPSAPVLAPAPSAPAPSAPLPPPSAPFPPPSAPFPPPSAPFPPPSAPLPAPSSPSGVPGSTPSQIARLRETVKVDLERVDSMVEMIGELIIVESMLKHSRELNNTTSVSMRNTLGQLGKISRDLQNAAMRMRTVPVHAAFQKMARLTRELGRKAGKEVVLVTHGEGTEMDRAMVERLEDPLVHMVRNACDHGIETPAAREAVGKPPIGVLTLSASHKGGSIVIELSDDGAGLNRERILKKAVARGLVPANAALTDAEVFQLIFAPGFSTAEMVTEVSGRGVGMDVVKRNVEGMRGRVLIESTLGQGTTFRLVLPLTLAIIDGMLISVGQERYLVPSLSIVEALQPTPAMLTSLGERDELLTVRGQVMPMLRLSKLLGVEGARVDPTTALVVVVESVGKRIGLLVDEVIAQQQVVIKGLDKGVGRAEFYSGAAILSDGCVGLILNIDKLCGLISYKHRATSGDAQLEARP